MHKLLFLSFFNFSSYSEETNLYVYMYVPNASAWPRYSQRSGGDRASDEKSGGKSRQLATSASKESKSGNFECFVSASGNEKSTSKQTLMIAVDKSLQNHLQ